MAHLAYRKAPGTNWIIVILTLLAVAGQIGMVPLLGHGPVKNWYYAVFFLPMIVALLLGIIICRGYQKRRLIRLNVNLKAMGLQASTKPSEESRALLWNYVSSLKSVFDLRGDGRNVRWYATIDGLSTPLCLFEFSFVTGSGKTSVEHIRTVAAWVCPEIPGPIQPATALPGFILWRPYLIQRRAFKASEITMPKHPEIVKKWAPFGNADTADLFLIPPVVEELARSPRGESWYLGYGWFCCCYNNLLHPDDLAAFVDRSKKVMALVSKGSSSGMV